MGIDTRVAEKDLLAFEDRFAHDGTVDEGTGLR
jgi:hypothetical protein